MVRRYLGSFVFTSFTYSGIFVLFLYLFNTAPIIAEKNHQTIQSIKIALIDPLPKIEPKPIEQKHLPQPIVKKIEPKPIETKPKPVEKIIKKPLPLPKEPLVEKKVAPLEQIPVQQITPAAKPIVAKKQVIAPPKVDVETIKNLFLSDLRNKINANKFYPKVAQRRGIEGNVKVSFYILHNGQLGDITIISGKKVFNEAVTNAIKNSFPIKVPKELINFPMNVNLQLNFSLS